jgi:hypothetical protein
MPRGGKRENAGRRKSERPVDGNFARKLKAKIKAEQLYLFAVKTAYEKAKETGNTADLVKLLMYLDDRDLGRPVDTVNHLHDKPIEMNVSLSLSEAVQKARKRATESPR